MPIYYRIPKYRWMPIRWGCLSSRGLDKPPLTPQVVQDSLFCLLPPPTFQNLSLNSGTILSKAAELCGMNSQHAAPFVPVRQARKEIPHPLWVKLRYYKDIKCLPREWLADRQTYSAIQYYILSKRSIQNCCTRKHLKPDFSATILTLKKPS